MWEVTLVVRECRFPSPEALVGERDAQACREQLRKKAKEETRKKRVEQLSAE